jgi:sugar lactone lactonase YvrE
VEGLRKPHEVAVDAQGNLFVADDSLGELTKLSPSGERCTISRGSHDYLGLAVDTHGVLYAADLRGNAIHRFAPALP